MNGQFSYLDHNAKNMQFWLGGGGGAGLILKNKIGLIFRPSYPLAYINIHATFGSIPIRIFVRLMKCLRNDVTMTKP